MYNFLRSISSGSFGTVLMYGETIQQAYGAWMFKHVLEVMQRAVPEVFLRR